MKMYDWKGEERLYWKEDFPFSDKDLYRTQEEYQSAKQREVNLLIKQSILEKLVKQKKN